MKLSKRLQAIHDEIPHDAIIADIGTDHGLLMIAAIQSGRATFAYGLDINPDPLQQAHDNVVRFDLQDKIQLILSDGLKSFEHRANTFVLAGMGSDLIWNIMKDYPFEADDTIIIQSNTKHYDLRLALVNHGFTINKEIYLMDQNKPVFIQVVQYRQADPISLCQAHLGVSLEEAQNPEYKAYLEQRSDYLSQIAHNNSKLNEEYQCILGALKKGAANE